MAPEQARGEVDALDERADVFALGSILCEILTGSPAFTGRTSGEIQRKAARGEAGRRRGPAGRLRGRRGAPGAGHGLPGRRAGGPAPRRRGRGRAAVGAPGGRAGAAPRRRARPGRGPGPRRRGAAPVPAGRGPGRLDRGADDPRWPGLHLRAARKAAGPRGRGPTGYWPRRRCCATSTPQAREDVARWERTQEALDRIGEELGPLVSAPLAAMRREVGAGLGAAKADRGSWIGWWTSARRRPTTRTARPPTPHTPTPSPPPGSTPTAATRPGPAPGSPAARSRWPRPWSRRWTTGPPSTTPPPESGPGLGSAAGRGPHRRPRP